MAYPSLRKHHESIELKRTNFSSQSHRYVAFGFDLHNDETVRFMIKDVKENRIVGVKGWANNMIQADNVLFKGEKGVFFVKTINRRPAQLYYQGFST
jgi:protease II